MSQETLPTPVLDYKSRDFYASKKRIVLVAAFLGYILATGLLTGCCWVPTNAFNSAATQSAPADTWTRAEIICGLSKPSGVVVTETEWQKFVDEEVTPRFEGGLTIISGTGQWKGASGKVEREPSRVIVIVYEDAKDAGAKNRLHAVAAGYGKRFGQEAVLLIRSRAEVEFVAGPVGK